MKFQQMIAGIGRLCKALAAVGLAANLAACAISVQGKASLLKKDAQEAERSAADALALARLLLESGRTADDVEQILRGRGLDSETARRVVALAAGAKANK